VTDLYAGAVDRHVRHHGAWNRTTTRPSKSSTASRKIAEVGSVAARRGAAQRKWPPTDVEGAICSAADGASKGSSKDNEPMARALVAVVLPRQSSGDNLANLLRLATVLAPGDFIS
jgi:hypothetical protein